ncbi:MAG: alpha-amylase family glycosyl hydrolase [Actinomycetota bacterium]
MSGAVTTLAGAIEGLYGERAEATLAAVLDRIERAPAGAARDLPADWHQQPGRVGYAAYADRFGGDLAGVEAHIPYLVELGVEVLHLMSVLRPRAGENDGGFAVADYRSPDPRLGTLDDLRSLSSSLRAAGIRLCLDLVLNHTSDDHEWARKARAGSAYHRALYHVFEDRTLPDRYERTLPHVFPELAPGNFTFVPELDGWVWTTFHDYQWDLDWSNPDVLLEMVDVVLHLAELGVDMVRLDAIAFTWKRLGTDCQNQPEAHLVAAALRAVLRLAAPGVVTLAEAIVGPDHLLAYLDECDLAYHNQLMVMGWSMLAERNASLATAALKRLDPAPPHAAWLTYVRCHDDIGWAVDDVDAAAVGLSGSAHRAFLTAFYRGDFPGSFARGTPFSNAPDGDERTCGMTSTLTGLAAADATDATDAADSDLALRRYLLLYALAFGYGGIPLIWMGDELALGDGPAGADTRWLQRPAMDWAAAERRHDPSTREGAVWAGLRRLVSARRACPALHAAASVRPVDVGEPAVFAWLRQHEEHGTLLGLANVGEQEVHVDPVVLDLLGTPHGIDLLAPADEAPDTPLTTLAPLQVRWCVPG